MVCRRHSKFMDATTTMLRTSAAGTGTIRNVAPFAVLLAARAVIRRKAEALIPYFDVGAEAISNSPSAFIAASTAVTQTRLRETRLRGWGGRTRTQKCRRKTSL